MSANTPYAASPATHAFAWLSRVVCLRQRFSRSNLRQQRCDTRQMRTSLQFDSTLKGVRFRLEGMSFGHL